MKRFRFLCAGGVAGVASLALLTGGALPAVAADLPVERLSGPTGVETSLAVAKHTWGGAWPVVYVASNRNPVDALPAATIGDGPVILTDGNKLDLGGVKPGKIVILGGPAAIAKTIEDQAKATGVQVTRLAGADRNATAEKIAKRWVEVNKTPKVVYITKNLGAGSPDAVAASVLRDGPILTFTSDAAAATLGGIITTLNPQKVVALGGPSVVSDAMLRGAAVGKATGRLAGADRYATAFEIAKYAKSQKQGNNIYLAAGTALKDAMVAGAAKDGVILLSPANGAGVKAQADALGASKLVAIGGTKVLPESTLKAAATGAAPAKSLKNMTLAEMRQAFPESVEAQEAASYENMSRGYDYCLGNSGKSLFMANLHLEKPTTPIYKFAQPKTGMTPESYAAQFPWLPKDSIKERYNELKAAKAIDPSVLYGWGAYFATYDLLGVFDVATGAVVPADKRRLVREEYFNSASECRPGAKHPEWTKPFPEGKRLETIATLPGAMSHSSSCALSGSMLKCFYWYEDGITAGLEADEPGSKSNPYWFYINYNDESDSRGFEMPGF